MNNSSFNGPVPDWYQLGLTEYIVLVNPNKSVYESVMLEKEYFQDKFGADIATRTLPHITLANLLFKKQMEGALCSCLERICGLQYSFAVALKNFGGFPSHAIYINVLQSESFKKLIVNLKVLECLIKENDCPPLQLVSRLHMTIARRLDEWTYNKAIVEYKERTFSELFTLDKVTLLKRDSRYAKWQKVGDFSLPSERTLFN